ncbi:MAG: SDR family NAD(P)-dependent oxidoreductase, partial [Alphaproteobacteria bacterium]|nr:SDR family NAD(P)-dependent oxidoreductase [Alphaproteobacteria bacterium]
MATDYAPGIDLTGQLGIVTGAAQGIGRACAQALAGYGASIALVDVSADGLDETRALIEAAGGKAECLPLDITDEDAVSSGFAGVAERHGQLDMLVNAAGVICENVPAEEAKM